MTINNYEFKAKIEAIEPYEQKLHALHPIFKGTDIQTDTYFRVSKGRLKLREGNIENALIYYERDNISGAKASRIILYRHEPDAALKEILTQQFGIKIVVLKKRKIYFVDYVKFHFDELEGLGTFLEVEVIDNENKFSMEELKNQCHEYLDFFGLAQDQLLDNSYSDMIFAGL